MSVMYAVTSYTPASVLNQTQIGCTMTGSSTNKYKALASTVMLMAASMIGIPAKSYVNQVHSDPDPKCVEVGPKYWTPYMSKVYARGFMATEYPSWGRAEWRALMKLWGKESAWNHKADNPTSTAYGIAQILGTKPGTPAPQQVARGLDYISNRYERPSIAWSHWRKHGWY